MVRKEMSTWYMSTHQARFKDSRVVVVSVLVQSSWHLSGHRRPVSPPILWLLEDTEACAPGGQRQNPGAMIPANRLTQSK